MFRRQLENPIGAGPRIKLHKNLLFTFAIYHTTVLVTLYSRVSQHRINDEIMNENQEHTMILKHLGIQRDPVLIDMDGLTRWHSTVKKYYDHNFYKPNWMDLGLNHTDDLNNYNTMLGPFMSVSNISDKKLILRNMQDWMTISRHYEMTMLDSKVCTWALDHIGSISLCMIVMPLYSHHSSPDRILFFNFFVMHQIDETNKTFIRQN